MTALSSHAKNVPGFGWNLKAGPMPTVTGQNQVNLFLVRVLCALQCKALQASNNNNKVKKKHPNPVLLENKDRLWTWYNKFKTVEQLVSYVTVWLLDGQNVNL